MLDHQLNQPSESPLLTDAYQIIQEINQTVLMDYEYFLTDYLAATWCQTFVNAVKSSTSQPLLALTPEKRLALFSSYQKECERYSKQLITASPMTRDNVFYDLFLVVLEDLFHVKSNNDQLGLTSMQEMYCNDFAKHCSETIAMYFFNRGVAISDLLFNKIRDFYDNGLQILYRKDPSITPHRQCDQETLNKTLSILEHLIEIFHHRLVQIEFNDYEESLFHLLLISLEESGVFDIKEIYQEKVNRAHELHHLHEKIAINIDRKAFDQFKFFCHKTMMANSFYWSIQHTLNVNPSDLWLDELKKVIVKYLTINDLNFLRLYDIPPFLNYFIRLIKQDPLIQDHLKLISLTSEMGGSPNVDIYAPLWEQCYKVVLMALNLIQKYAYEDSVWLNDTFKLMNQDFVSMSFDDMKTYEIEALKMLKYRVRYYDDPDFNRELLFSLLKLSLIKKNLDKQLVPELTINSLEQRVEQLCNHLKALPEFSVHSQKEPVKNSLQWQFQRYTENANEVTSKLESLQNQNQIINRQGEQSQKSIFLS